MILTPAEGLFRNLHNSLSRLGYLPELEIQGAIFEGHLSDKISLRNERNFSGRQQEGVLLGIVSPGSAAELFPFK